MTAVSVLSTDVRVKLPPYVVQALCAPDAACGDEAEEVEDAFVGEVAEEGGREPAVLDEPDEHAVRSGAHDATTSAQESACNLRPALAVTGGPVTGQSGVEPPSTVSVCPARRACPSRRARATRAGLRRVTAKVQLGFFSFTEVTDPSEHRSYNEWHQLDHLPAQYVLPGIVTGQRWVCSPECRRERVFDSDLFGSAHYMTLYLMSEPVRETLEGFSDLARLLHEAGRFHGHRRARVSGPFDVAGAHAAERVLVSSDVVPFRPNRGVYVVVEKREDETAPWRSDEGDLNSLLSQRGVAGAWRFVSNQGYEHLRWRPGDRRITVCYLDEPPLELAPSLGEAVAEIWSDGRTSPGVELEFAGPFETVVPWQWDWFDRT